MAMRRPRIKASANLTGIKRKPKPKVEDNKIVETATATEEPSVVEATVEPSAEEPNAVTESVFSPIIDNDNAQSEKPMPAMEDLALLPHVAPIESERDVVTAHALEHIEPALPIVADYQLQLHDVAVTAAVEDSLEVVIPVASILPNADLGDNSSFKCPLKVDYNRSNSHTALNNSDDVFHTDLEENNVIQMDMQKSANGHPMSPSKAQARQRIRATPIFGQRRNSFVGSSPSPHTGGDDVSASMDFAVPASSPTATTTPRRERHYSASHSQTSNTSSSAQHFHTTPHKYPPIMGMGRIRTESGCSTFSDTYASTSSKSRKADLEHNHRTISRRDFEARFTNGVPDKSSLKMFDLIYYNPVTNPMEQKQNLNIKKEAAAVFATNPDDPSTEDSKTTIGELMDDASAVPVPQLKLNSNGELILDDKSLEIETTAEQEARKVLANSSLIFLDENTGMNGFYKRQKRTKEWPPEETIKFYRCLQTIGTDFSLMCQLFPQRTRRDLKLKFKKEERCNGSLINKALLYPKIFNIEELKQQLETEEREREEAERKWKEIKAKEANSLKKTAKVKTSTAARALKNGDDVYQNENIVKSKLGKRAVKKAKPAEPSNSNDNDIVVIADDKPKRKRKRTVVAVATTVSQAAPPLLPTPQMNKVKIEDVCIISPPFAVASTIKTETIKAEQHSMQATYAANVCTADNGAEYVDSNELENELTELLHSEAVLPHDNQQLTMYAEETVRQQEPYYNVSNTMQHAIAMSSPMYVSPPADATHYQNQTAEEEFVVPQKTLVNLDDGSTVKLVNDLQEDESMLSMDDAMSVASNRDMDECDIQQILTELAEGTLVLVSTLDPENADKVLNEIYMLDKNTGELCNEPLDIPQPIVHAILSVMS